MRHLPEPQGFRSSCHSATNGDETAIIGPQELALRQQPEELGLREVMPRGPAAVGREGLVPDSQASRATRAARLRHAAHQTLAFRVRLSSKRRPDQKVSTK
jgi:hypothetical protein